MIMYWNTQYCHNANYQIYILIQCNPDKNFSRYTCGNWHVDSKIHTELQGTQNAQNNLEKEEQSRRTHISWFQSQDKATKIRTVWCWHKYRHIGQWYRIDSHEINSYIYGQLIFDKGSSVKGSSVETTCKRMKLDSELMPHIKVNSKWSKT